MKELTATFDENITLIDFDKEIIKLIQNFPSEINIFIKVICKTDCIFVSIAENFNKNAFERITWNFNII